MRNLYRTPDWAGCGAVIGYVGRLDVIVEGRGWAAGRGVFVCLVTITMVKGAFVMYASTWISEARRGLIMGGNSEFNFTVRLLQHSWT